MKEGMVFQLREPLPLLHSLAGVVIPRGAKGVVLRTWLETHLVLVKFEECSAHVLADPTNCESIDTTPPRA